MATTRRERVLDAAPGAVWAVVGNAHHQPRWWPLVTRVEGVSGGRFTQVFTSPRGNTVRADQRVVERDEGRRIAWELELPGTPYERMFRLSRTIVEVEPADGDRTRVRLVAEQQLRGLNRFGGGVMVRRGTGRILEQALEGLARAV